MYFNYREIIKIDWTKWPGITEEIVKTCAVKAYEKGFRQAFGVQFYGECWSDSNAESRYSMHNISSACISGVGEIDTNFVYHMSGKNCI